MRRYRVTMRRSSLRVTPRHAQPQAGTVCHAGGRGFESRRSRLLKCLQVGFYVACLDTSIPAVAQTCPSVSEQNACKWRFRGQTCSRVSRTETVHGCELLCLVQDVSGHWRQLWGRLGAESTRTRATPTGPNRPPGETPLRRGTIHHPARSHGTLAEFSGRLELGPPTSRPRSGGSTALAARSRTSTSPRPGRARHARERHERASDAAHRGATVAAISPPRRSTAHLPCCEA